MTDRLGIDRMAKLENAATGIALQKTGMKYLGIHELEANKDAFYYIGRH